MDCSSYRRKALVKRRGSASVDETHTYGIAAVVTPVKHLREPHSLHLKERVLIAPLLGKGFATHHLRLLHYLLADPSMIPPFPEQWGAPPPPLPPSLRAGLPRAIGSILWSDVGSTFYSRCTIGPSRSGWVVRDHESTELVWKILFAAEKPDQSWELLYESDFPSIAKTLSASARAKLGSVDTGRTRFTNDPASPGTLGFVPIRGSFVEPPRSTQEPYGVRLKSPGREDAIVLFTAFNTHVGPRMLITCIHNLLPSDLPTLLQALDAVAAKAGRDEGWVWNLDPEGELARAWRELPGRDVRAGRRAEKFGHLLGVAFYGPEEEQEGAELADGQMWSWC